MAIIDVLMTDLFNNRRFVIPNYQRHYAWEEEQCQALIDDLDVIDLGNGSHERFMGYITTITPDSTPIMTTQFQALSERQVVDGQQRLTSLSLLVAAIARYFDKNDNSALASSLRVKYLAADTNSGQLPLLLVQDLKAFAQPHQNGPIRSLYWSLITGTPLDGQLDNVTIPAMTKLKKASDLFDRHLKDLAVDQVQDLLVKIQTRIRFGLNEASSIVHAGDMFEGLNNRGKPLSDLERIKSHAVYVSASLLPAGKTVSINSQTYTQQQLVEASNEWVGDTYYALDRMDIGAPSYEVDLILAHHPTILSALDSILAPIYQKPPYNGLLPISREQPSDFFRNNLGLKQAVAVTPSTMLLEASVEYLESLANAAPYYADIRKPNHAYAFESWTQAQDPCLGNIVNLSDALVSLRKSKHYAPVLLACRMLDPRNSADYCRLVKAVETVAFWSLALKRGEFGASAVNGIAEDISAGDKSIDQCITDFYRRAAQTVLKKAGNRLDLDNDDIRDAIDNKDFDTIGKAIRFIVLDDGIDRDVFHHMLFEFWNSKVPNLFSSRSAVASAINKEEYFVRVIRPGRGRPVQPQLSGSSASDRTTWSSHVSNYIPAINAAQRQVMNNVGRDASFDLLAGAGVDDHLLLGNRLDKDLVQNLFDEFNVFIAQRWWPDLGLDYDCTQQLPALPCANMLRTA